MADTTFDLLVIGGGPGGYTAAIRAAQLGMKTGIIERDRLGGICLNWGCIPSKALLKNAEILHTIRNAGEWGITYDNLRVDFGKIIKRSRGVADRLSKGVEYLMRKNKIEHMPGFAVLTGKGTVELRAEGAPPRKISAQHIVLATGARPRALPGAPFDRKRIITSTEAMTLPAQPASMVIIGAGAIGMEFAYFYNAIGTKVTVVEMMPGVLPVEDAELTKLLEASFTKQGVAILTGTRVEGVKTSASGITVAMQTPEGKKKPSA